MDRDDTTRLRLRAQGAKDIEVFSSLLQDAILPLRNIEWDRRRRRLILVAQRYRWEGGSARVGDSEAGDDSGERIASAIRFDGVLRFQSRGVDPGPGDRVAYLLRIQFEATDEPEGELRFLCCDNVEFRARVECVDGFLMDVSRPWIAARRPSHPVDE